MIYVDSLDQLSWLAEEIGLVYYTEEAPVVIYSEGWIATFPVFDDDGNEIDEERGIDAAAIVDTCRRCNVDADTDGTHAARVYLF